MRWYGLQGCGLRLFCTALILTAGCANQTEVPAEKGNWLKSFGADFCSWPQRVLEDSGDTFLRTDNLTALLLAGGASIAMHNSDADKNIWGNLRRHRGIDGFASETFNTIGCPGFHFAAAGLWYALSADKNDDFNQQRAWTMMTALAVNGLVTVGLKAVRDNDTPNGKSWAWPSGHTSSSFTAASVLDEFYGPRVGVPAYILASLVAYRMMAEGDHWASDIVFGATLGWVVGHTVAGKHKQLEVAGFELLPYTDGSAAGVILVKQF
jgi:membrane-associated phospholipid phosphatase